MATNCLNIKVLDNIKVKEFLLTLLQENRHSAYTHRYQQGKERRPEFKNLTQQIIILDLLYETKKI